MAEYLLCIDDTDNLESPGSGHLLAEIAVRLERAGLARTSRITRHQLYVHPDVPYTSHNSSMCIALEAEDSDEVYNEAKAMLIELAAEGSDPGICFGAPDRLRDPERLLDFGRRAKREVLTRAEACATAAACGLRLEELGGTGDGIIGAVAGIALRLDGNDGRYRGRLSLCVGEPATVGDLLKLVGIDAVCCADSLTPLAAGAAVAVDSEVKTIHRGGRSVLPLLNTGDRWRSLDRTETKQRFP